MLMREIFNLVVWTKGKHSRFSPLPKNQLLGNDRQKLIRSLTKTRTTHSRPEPVVSWSRGRKTRVGYKLSRVALGTRMRTTTRTRFSQY